MQKIEKYISDLLTSNDCIIIPGFGAFIGNYYSSYLVENQVFPPSKRIAFNQSLKTNDGLLAHHISQSENISYQNAIDFLQDIVEQWNHLLLNQHEIVLNKIGRLQKNEEGNILFHPFNSYNFLTDSFGLPVIPLKMISRRNLIPDFESVKQSSTSINSNKKFKNSNKKIIYYGLSVYLPLLVLFWVVLLVREPFNGQTASLYPYSPVSEVKSDAQYENVILSPDTSKKNIQIIDTQTTSNLTPPSYYIIGGCFKDKKNAINYKNSLVSKKYENAGLISDNQYNRVYYDKFTQEKLAQQCLINILKQENTSAWILKQ